eukprot:4342737-Pleurochrysis_carterae.AAC.1
MYARVFILSAGSLRVQALCAELSRVDIGGGSVLSSVDGAAEVVLRGGSVQVRVLRRRLGLGLGPDSGTVALVVAVVVAVAVAWGVGFCSCGCGCGRSYCFRY